jgi:hypothetical protein
MYPEASLNELKFLLDTASDPNADMAVVAECFKIIFMIKRNKAVDAFLATHALRFAKHVNKKGTNCSETV